MASRSTTGCYTCKTRRKKCDETHPQCQRCTKLGLECGGYEYIEGRGGKNRKRRTIPAPRAASESTWTSSAVATPAPSDSQHTSDSSLNLLDPPMAVTLFPVVTPSLISFDQIVDPDCDASLEQAPIDSLEFSLLADSYDPVDDINIPSNIDAYSSLQPRTGDWCPNDDDPSLRTSPSSSQYDATAQLYSKGSFGDEVGALDFGQATSFRTLDPGSLPQSQPQLFLLPESNMFASSSHWLPINTEDDDESDDDDPEGVTQILCSGPVMDSSATSNLLPFVLQSYANWMKLVSFDPARNARQTKDALIRQISGSEMARAKIALIANAMKTLHDTSPLDPQAVRSTLMLTAAVRRAALFYQTSPRARQPDLDRQNALRVLDNTIEIVAIQTYSMTMASSIELIECIAPVFRRACPDPPNTPINLCNILLESDANLRYFAITDIWLSSTTGRSMLFRYDVDFSINLCETMRSKCGDFGLQWLHGIPSQFMTLMAFMNQLRDDAQARGQPVSEGIVTRIEADMKNLKNYSDLVEDRDPVLNLRRRVIQECCHQAAYVYLYMALCGASADDPRVKSAHRTFIRLVNEVKPARNPDTFLTIPWIIVGVATTKQRDRDMLYQRLYPLPECGIPGTCGHDAIRMLSDVWSRTASEGRPAVWNDMRIACFRIAGT